MPRLNLLVTDSDFRKLVAVARCQRLNPGVWARMVVMREVDRVVLSGGAEGGRFEQLSVALSGARGSRRKS